MRLLNRRFGCVQFFILLTNRIFSKYLVETRFSVFFASEARKKEGEVVHFSVSEAS
jgi:hypothetical protein